MVVLFSVIHTFSFNKKASCAFLSQIFKKKCGTLGKDGISQQIRILDSNVLGVRVQNLDCS